MSIDLRERDDCAPSPPGARGRSRVARPTVTTNGVGRNRHPPAARPSGVGRTDARAVRRSQFGRRKSDDLVAADLLAPVEALGRLASGLDRLGRPLREHRPPFVESMLVLERGRECALGRAFGRHGTSVTNAPIRAMPIRRRGESGSSQSRCDHHVARCDALRPGRDRGGETTAAMRWPSRSTSSVPASPSVDVGWPTRIGTIAPAPIKSAAPPMAVCVRGAERA